MTSRYKRDQAENLREQVQNRRSRSTNEEATEKLPSRIEVHRNRRNKMKWKLKFPLVRFLLLLFILLVIVALSSPYWIDRFFSS
ncbi:hypothetical protein [Halalkalibacterium ligniniphilum]|uniref:hypothetical protein n=1 Tax=Halalkalibacterium ligniniphilum TaxID=1134413 RepID=UPI000373B1E9|nr:hypothetical protein [Halalkalibacterium ligniniphilum]